MRKAIEDSREENNGGRLGVMFIFTDRFVL